MLNVFQVFKIARVSKRIKVDNLIIRIVVYKQAHYMRPDKTPPPVMRICLGIRKILNMLRHFRLQRKEINRTKIMT